LEIFLPGACVPKGRPRVTFQHGKAFAYTPKRTRKYADAARLVSKNVYQLAGEYPVSKEKGVVMNVEFVRREFPNKRPDIFNMLMQIADVLESVAYEDDCQVVEVHAYKRKGKIPITRVELTPCAGDVLPQSQPDAKKGKDSSNKGGNKGNKKVT